MGPIELADTVGLDIRAHGGRILGFSAEGSRLERLVAAGKLGHKTGEGFYAWKDGTPAQTEKPYDKRELERLGRELVEPLIRECEKSLAVGIVENADLVDAGVIFGTGFAPFRGGPLHYRASSSGQATPAQQAAE